MVLSRSMKHKSNQSYFVSNKVVVLVGSKVAIVKQPKIVKQLINTGKIKMQRSFGYRCIVSMLNAVANGQWQDSNPHFRLFLPLMRVVL